MNKNDKIKFIIITKLIKLMEDINIEEIPENENSKIIANNVEKILNFNFNEQQKGRGLQKLTPRQMLQRLPTALAQVKVANNLKPN